MIIYIIIMNNDKVLKKINQNKQQIKILEEENKKLFKKFQENCSHDSTFNKYERGIYGCDSSYLICKICDKILCYNHENNPDTCFGCRSRRNKL